MRPNPNATKIDDKVIATDALGTTKAIADTYAKYAIDSATPAVRQTLASLYMESLSENERVFRVMESRGWYNVNKADQQQISQIQSKFSSGPSGGIPSYNVGQAGYGAPTSVSYGPVSQYGAGSFGTLRY